MHAFTTLTATVVPLDRANVDTDAIIPKQFMKSIRRTGFGDNLFDEWRYLDRGEPGQEVTGVPGAGPEARPAPRGGLSSPAQPDLLSRRPLNPDFVLNQPRYRGAQILLTRENFGCGSSREHAPWALRDWGIRALIAPSFADIFHGNCFKNGLLPLVLPAATVQHLFEATTSNPGFALTIDLAAQAVTTPAGEVIRFAIDADRKHRLLNGLDDIALTLARAERIRAYEARRRELEPWLFA